MEMGVGRIGIVGVTVMAFLSGYPSICCFVSLSQSFCLCICFLPISNCVCFIEIFFYVARYGAVNVPYTYMSYFLRYFFSFFTCFSFFLLFSFLSSSNTLSETSKTAMCYLLSDNSHKQSTRY